MKVTYSPQIERVIFTRRYYAKRGAVATAIVLLAMAVAFVCI